MDVDNEGAVHAYRALARYIRESGGPLSKLPEEHSIRMIAREWYKPDGSRRTLPEVVTLLNKMLTDAVEGKPARIRRVE